MRHPAIRFNGRDVAATLNRWASGSGGHGRPRPPVLFCAAFGAARLPPALGSARSGGAVAVARAADGLDGGAGGAELAADLHDVLVEGAARGDVVHAPHGVEQRVA